MIVFLLPCLDSSILHSEWWLNSISALTFLFHIQPSLCCHLTTTFLVFLVFIAAWSRFTVACLLYYIKAKQQKMIQIYCLLLKRLQLLRASLSHWTLLGTRPQYNLLFFSWCSTARYPLLYSSDTINRIMWSLVMFTRPNIPRRRPMARNEEQKRELCRFRYLNSTWALTLLLIRSYDCMNRKNW